MRFPRGFYGEFYRYRDGFGANEYDRDDIVPGVVAIITRYISDPDAWKTEIANKLLNDVEQREDKKRTDQGDLFSYDAHVALGDKIRVKRGCMNLGHHWRRKRVIDRNKVAQDQAWAEETSWLEDGLEALQGRPTETVRCDVLNEDGTIKAARRPSGARTEDPIPAHADDEVAP